ncbi:hypothetical protein V1506DRAFT_555943 [Lipomyces tetrasporus]
MQQHHATTGFPAAVVNNPQTLHVGMEFESVDQARQFVNAYAIGHNFAVKNGFVKNKDQTLLLSCKCAKKPFNSRKLPVTKGSTGDNGLTRKRDARSMLCNFPWILIDQHEGHQLEGINVLAYPENRPMAGEASHTMRDLVRHSSASLTTIASVINTTYGLSLLGRDVYNRTYDYAQCKGTSTARFI